MSSQAQTDETAQVIQKEQSEVQQPPKAPDIQPRFKLYNYQKIGIPILLLIPLLALFGLFGVSTEQVQAANDDVAVTVQYPTRFRYKMIETIDVGVTNQTDSTLDTVTVRFDREYIDKFSTVEFTPSVSQITDHYYEVELKDIAAGETRYVSVEIQSEEYGLHEGAVVVETPSGEPVEFKVSTLSLP